MERIVSLAISFWLVGVGVAVAATDTIVPTDTYDSWCDSGQGNGTNCQTDNADVYYYMDSAGEYELEAEDRAVVIEMFTAQYSPTDLVRHYDSNPSFDGGSETDHVWQEWSTGLGDDSVGQAWCNDALLFSHACDQHYIRIRGNGNIDPSVTCHEMGHAVGLVHGSRAYPVRGMEDRAAMGCMIKTGYEDQLGSNNANGINSSY